MIPELWKCVAQTIRKVSKVGVLLTPTILNIIIERKSAMSDILEVIKIGKEREAMEGYIKNDMVPGDYR